MGMSYGDSGILVGAKNSLGLLPKKKTYDSAALTNLFATLYGGVRTNYGMAEQELRSGLNQVDTGYRSAEANAQLAAKTDRRAVLGQQSQALGAAQTANVESGLANTTAGIGQYRSVYNAGSQALAGVDANLAEILANLDMGRGEARAEALSGLGNLMQSKQMQLTNIGGRKSVAIQGGWTGSANALGGKKWQTLKGGFKQDLKNYTNQGGTNSQYSPMGAGMGYNPFFT